jgi:hypothetical protein
MYLPKEDLERHVSLQKEIRENDQLKKEFKDLR